MLDSLKSGIARALGWTIGGIATIASAFSAISTNARDIPVVGEVLANTFTWVQSLFNDLGYNIVEFKENLDDALGVISGWLDQVADLTSDVNQWISQGISEISFDLSALRDIVVDWITEVLSDVGLDIEEIASNAWDWFLNQAGTIWGTVLDVVDYVASGSWTSFVAERISIAVRDAFAYITDDFIPGVWDAIKADILGFIAPVYNLVEFFFNDIQDFFNDPADYFEKKLEQFGSPFADRLWAFIEKILEKIW